jgi:protein TonB
VAKRESFVLPLVATVALHALFAAGLHAAERFVKVQRPKAPLEVSFEVKKAPPPPPPPVVEPPPPPPPEPPKVAEPPTPKKKVVAKAVEPPRAPPPPDTPPPAPGPVDEPEAAPQRVYVLPGSGQVAVNPGSALGKATGRPGATGTGTGGAGGEPGGTGKVVALASVKRMPEAVGDYDLSKDYPPEARRLGVEGQVAVRLLVDETGKVSQARLVRGLGHGLDGKALELARKIRFRPALDGSDRPVATWITWTFTFTLPR